MLPVGKAPYWRYRMSRFIPAAVVAFNVLAVAAVAVAPWMWG